MSPREQTSKEGQREQNSAPGARGGSRRTKNQQHHEKKQEKKQSQRLPVSPQEESKREDDRKFVPWLGEARPKWGPIYNFEEKIGQRIQMEFVSGRNIEGKLVSYDRSTNLVLEDTIEFLDEGKTRELGKVFTCGRVESIGPAGVPVAE